MRDDQARRRILGVGIATLDLINTVAVYPPEDAEVRAAAQRRARGGNCTNTLAVLADLGHACAWVGMLAEDLGGAFIQADLNARGIDCRQAVRVPGGISPTSYVTLSQATGSRTIVHYRDLPELDAAAFARIPLDGWHWIHFEGRNPQETRQMLARCRRALPRVPLSVELEKPRSGIESLLRGPDLLLIARGFALADGGPGVADDPRVYLTELAKRTTADILVLGWGDAGAWLLVRDTAPLHLPACAPERVVDTLGAGDVLNAGMIDGLLRGASPADALTRAIALAGLKCGRSGFDGLAAAILKPAARQVSEDPVLVQADAQALGCGPGRAPEQGEEQTGGEPGVGHQAVPF